MVPRFESSPLIKSRYQDCYKVAITVKRRHPDWGATRVASEVRRETGVRVPEMTVYYWISNRSKPNIVPVRIRPELGYAIGALMSDCSREEKVVLRVTDLDYALSFKRALLTTTGREYEVKWDKKRGYG